MMIDVYYKYLRKKSENIFIFNMNVYKMDDVAITSLPYGYTINVEKDRLLHVLPDSLLSATLELDQSATEIPISNPIVTPNVLRAVEYLINNGKVPPFRPSIEYYLASRYLLIDQLATLGTPVITALNAYLKIEMNILDVRQLRKHYEGIITFAVDHDDAVLLQYVLSKVPYKTLTPYKRRVTYREFLRSIGAGYTDLINVFLQYGVDPSMNGNESLLNALIRGYTNIVDILLADPRVNPNDNQIGLITTFLDFNNEEALHHYFSLPGFIPSQLALSIANEYGWTDLSNISLYKKDIW